MIAHESKEMGVNRTEYLAPIEGELLSIYLVINTIIDTVFDLTDVRAMSSLILI